MMPDFYEGRVRMQAEYKTKTRLFWKISTVVLISVVTCVLCAGGFIFSYMKPMVEVSLLVWRKESKRETEKERKYGL